MAEDKKRMAGARGGEGRFISVPAMVLDSPAWAALSGNEKGLLMDIAAQFFGSNNGALDCTWSRMCTRGWRSRDTLSKALSGLIEKRFVVLTRQGGKRVCNLFAVTWREIHECGGRLDVAPTRVPSHAWRDWRPKQNAIDTPGGTKRQCAFDTPGGTKQPKSLDTPGGLNQHARRVKSRVLARPPC